MITLRLFHSADPFREIEARTLKDDDIVVGRDPAADWFVHDAASELSRRHCVLATKEGRVLLRDLSANGVYLGADRQRVERETEVELVPGEAIHLGQFMIVVDKAGTPTGIKVLANSAEAEPSSLDAPFHAPLLANPLLSQDDFAVPADWSGDTFVRPAPAPQAAPLTDAALLDAFCEGAQLDASSFAGQDPVVVMRRVGAVYRQVVLGVGDLLAERTSVKAEYRMDRTTVGAGGNNPFKWAPTQRVAVDLIAGQDENFLSGAAALKSSFEDLKKHLLCLLAGSRAAVHAAFDSVDPAKVEEAAKPLPLVGKGDALWRAFQRRHEEVAAEARASADSAVNRAFKRGYEHQLRELDDMGTQS